MTTRAAQVAMIVAALTGVTAKSDEDYANLNEVPPASNQRIFVKTVGFGPDQSGVKSARGRFKIEVESSSLAELDAVVGNILTMPRNYASSDYTIQTITAGIASKNDNAYAWGPANAVPPPYTDSQVETISVARNLTGEPPTNDQSYHGFVRFNHAVALPAADAANLESATLYLTTQSKGAGGTAHEVWQGVAEDCPDFDTPGDANALTYTDAEASSSASEWAVEAEGSVDVTDILHELIDAGVLADAGHYVGFRVKLDVLDADETVTWYGRDDGNTHEAKNPRLVLEFATYPYRIEVFEGTTAYNGTSWRSSFYLEACWYVG